MPNLVQRRLNSFGPAWKGIVIFFWKEENAWVHSAAIIAAVVLSIVFDSSPMEWLMITFAVLMVLATELLNTSIEKLCDFVHPDHHKTIGLVKDLAAGSVLVSSIVALIVAGVIFGPKIAEAIGG